MGERLAGMLPPDARAHVGDVPQAGGPSRLDRVDQFRWVKRGRRFPASPNR